MGSIHEKIQWPKMLCNSPFKPDDQFPMPILLKLSGNVKKGKNKILLLFFFFKVTLKKFVFQFFDFLYRSFVFYRV
jgi:hypothetical protein